MLLYTNKSEETYIYVSYMEQVLPYTSIAWATMTMWRCKETKIIRPKSTYKNIWNNIKKK